MPFGCNFNWENEYVSCQWDDKGNRFYYDPSIDGSYDGCSYSDWNIAPTILFSGNICRGIYNNTNTGNITDNIVIGKTYRNRNGVNNNRLAIW